MWNKAKQGKQHRYDTLISNQMEIKGDLYFSGGLHIDGKVYGSVIAEPGSGAVVRVSDHGLVEGELKAPHVIINGRVDGDVFSSEHVELAGNAVVNGTVHYKLIEMVVGAQVNGSLVHQEEPETGKGVSESGGATDEQPEIKSVSNS
ncbi:MAG: polymer-forming cytoskeletal protein [Pseudomonadales bacterium]|jgi:cytoskeletal protein CcmA (bactofilin family)